MLDEMAPVLAPQILAGFGLGLALGSSPGPVQAVLFGEAIRGGVARGFRAMAGANVTFGLLLVSLALGLTAIAPTGTALRILEVAGGAFLLWLAFDAFRWLRQTGAPMSHRRQLPPAARGAIAVVLNPGAWLFLATAASSLFGHASRVGGLGSAVATALALLLGLALGDSAIVLLGGIGLRRVSERAGRYVRRALAAVLATLGIWLLVQGFAG